MDFDDTNTKINDFYSCRKKIRVIRFDPVLSKVPINYFEYYRSSGKARMYYFNLVVNLWHWYQCFNFVFLTVPMIYFDRDIHKSWYMSTLL